MLIIFKGDMTTAVIRHWHIGRLCFGTTIIITHSFARPDRWEVRPFIDWNRKER
jgi:hypothetical protein